MRAGHPVGRSESEPVGLVYIEDDIHCEQDGPFASFAVAIAELGRRAVMAWDSPPNRAPCASWELCGREYHVLGYDEKPETWRLLRRARVLGVSAAGAVWIEGFNEEWDRGGV